jgi:SynChlorMet cassette radical SAM/SPASM protein ScmE
MTASPIIPGERSSPVMRTPRSVDLEITSRCNLRCCYCYHFRNGATGYRDRSTGEWLCFFEELGRSGVMSVCFMGGEPFIRRDLPDLLEGIVRNHMRFPILSNGGLVDDRIAAFLADTGRCDQLQISVDGPSPAVHDSFRGRGSFEAAVGGIRSLLRHGLPVTARVTIHRHNIDSLEDTARFLLDDLGLGGISTSAVGYLGECRRNSGDVLPTLEDRGRAMEILLMLAGQYEGRISATAGPLAEAHRWRRMEEARAGGESPFLDGGILSGCGCPDVKITVRSDGVMVPCTMLSHLELGRINRDSLADVWRHSPILVQLRRRRTISLMNFESCRDCSYTSYCTGSCPGSAYALTGLVDQPSPLACLNRYLVEGGSLPGMERSMEGKRGGGHPVEAAR